MNIVVRHGSANGSRHKDGGAELGNADCDWCTTINNIIIIIAIGNSCTFGECESDNKVISLEHQSLTGNLEVVSQL